MVKSYVYREPRWYRKAKKAAAGGRTTASWQRCKSTDQGATRRLDDHFTIELRVDGHRISRQRSFTIRDRAEAHARELQQRLERGESLDGPSHAEEQARPLQLHAEDWLVDLARKGRDDAYLRVVRTRMTTIIAGCGWKRLSQISAASFLAWRARTAAAKCWSARTQNHFRDVLVQFCNWAADGSRQRLKVNPIGSLESVEGARTFLRRAATPLELSFLFTAMQRKPAWQLAYAFSLTTGLRRNEQATLTWRTLHLDAGTPFVQPDRENQKSRRHDVIALHPMIVRELLARRPKGDGYDDAASVNCLRLPGIVTHRAILQRARKLFIADAVDAEDRAAREASEVLLYEDRHGRRFDLHACRTTLASQLQAGGASLDDAMRALRHTDRRLTLAVYTDESRLLEQQLHHVERLELPCDLGTTGDVHVSLPHPHEEGDLADEKDVLRETNPHDISANTSVKSSANDDELSDLAGTGAGSQPSSDLMSAIESLTPEQRAAVAAMIKSIAA